MADTLDNMGDIQAAIDRLNAMEFVDEDELQRLEADIEARILALTAEGGVEDEEEEDLEDEEEYDDVNLSKSGDTAPTASRKLHHGRYLCITLLHGSQMLC